MMQPAKNRIRNNVSEQLDRACVRRILAKRNVSSHLIIIDGIPRKNPSKVICVERDEMVSALAPERPDQTFNMAILPGRAERDGPIRDPHRAHPSFEQIAK